MPAPSLEGRSVGGGVVVGVGIAILLAPRVLFVGGD